MTHVNRKNTGNFVAINNCKLTLEQFAAIRRTFVPVYIVSRLYPAPGQVQTLVHINH